MNVPSSSPATARFLETVSTPATVRLWPWDPAPKGDIEFSFNMQDQVIMPPATAIVHGVQGAVHTEQAELRDHKPTPKDGRYVYDPASAEVHAALAFSAVARTIETFSAALGMKIPWAFGGARLGIHPDGGEDLNAYYARDDASLNFFHARDNKTGKTVYSGDSGEVVAHEAGHAILDAMRPGYFQAWSADAGAFHESFGDITAIIMNLLDARTRAKVIEQTGGDLTKPNAAADVGEEIGMAINHAAGRNATGGDYTRTARNRFTWQNPSTLPSNPKDPNELGSEFHNFSRLFTGAVYDVIAGINARNLRFGMSPDKALEATGKETLALYASLMKTAPQGDFTFKDMAVALVEADKRHHSSANAGLIVSVFKNRRILPDDFDPSTLGLAARTAAPRTVETVLSGPEFGRFEGARVATVSDSLHLVGSDESTRLREDLKRWIAEGRVLYTEPHQRVTTRDLFDAAGRPYIGVVRWLDGRMTIERVRIAG